MARLITADRQVRMPWRNGRGGTREVAAWPPGATLDTFAWRVSVATIAHSGPFSRFPGVARTLVLLSGTGVRLRGETTRIELATRFAAATLRGAEPIECELMGSGVEMFNVMVRGDTPARIVIGDTDRALPEATWRLCYAARGAVACDAGDLHLDLNEGDAVTLDQHEMARLSLHTPGAIGVVALIDAAGSA